MQKEIGLDEMTMTGIYEKKNIWYFALHCTQHDGSKWPTEEKMRAKQARSGTDQINVEVLENL
jgi:hypothetical protein